MRSSFGHSACFKIERAFLLKKVYLAFGAHNKKASEGLEKSVPQHGFPIPWLEHPRLFFSRAILALHLCELLKPIRYPLTTETSSPTQGKKRLHSLGTRDSRDVSIRPKLGQSGLVPGP